MIKETKKASYLAFVGLHEGLDSLSYITLVTDGYKSFEELTNENDASVIKECKKINDASYHRVKRLKETINYIIKRYDNSYFITLTFTDNILKSTSEETRKRYVTRYLKQFNCYVANVDYGSITKREHYHAVAGTLGDLDKINEYWSKKYGFVCIEPINVKQENNDIKLAKYVCKLTNHAIKETTKRKAVMYSRSL